MPIPTHASAVETGRILLADVVYDRLLDVIVSGELTPGEVVREEEIGEWLGVSRTPVRDAMRRLGEQGLLVYQPNRGTRVAALDSTHLENVLECAAALYGMAAELAATRLTPHDQQSIRDRIEVIVQSYVDGTDVVRASEVYDLLDVIVSRAHNPVLEQQIRGLRPHLQRLHGLVPEFPGQEQTRLNGEFLAAAIRSTDPAVAGEGIKRLALLVGRRLLAAARESGVAV